MAKSSDDAELELMTVKAPSSNVNMNTPPPLEIYSKLKSDSKEIRLIELLPDFSTKKSIKVRLRTARLTSGSTGSSTEPYIARAVETGGSLGSLLPYEALSYTWGASTENRTIECESGHHMHTMPVTDNLYSALRGLRPRHGGPRRLWVDAICINQADIDERSAQVHLMFDLYKAAECVNVFLGDPGAVNLVSRVFDLAITGVQGWRWFIAYDRHRFSLRELSYWRLADAAVSSMSPPWTDRTWCMQEFVAARQMRLVFGRRSLHARIANSTDAWTLVPRTWSRKFDRLRILGSRLTALSVTARSAVKTFDDSGIMDAIRDTDSTDPRDKVFAWLGCVSSNIAVDYTLPVWEVFARATHAIIDTSKLLRFLLLSRPSKSSIPYLPSWAADLRRSGVPLVSLYPDVALHEHFHSYTPRDPFSYELSPDARHLRLRCTRLVQLKHLAPIPLANQPMSEHEAQYLYSWRECIRVDIARSIREDFLHIPRMGSPDLPELLAKRSAMLDTVDCEEGSSAREFIYQIFEAWTSTFEQSVIDRPDLNSIFTDYSSYVDRAAEGAQIFSTDNQYLGFAPAEAQTNDWLVMVPGCSLVLVLRPRADSAGGHWNFLGFAYLHWDVLSLEYDGTPSSSAQLTELWEGVAKTGEDLWLC